MDMSMNAPPTLEKLDQWCDGVLVGADPKSRSIIRLKNVRDDAHAAQDGAPEECRRRLAQLYFDLLKETSGSTASEDWTSWETSVSPESVEATVTFIKNAKWVYADWRVKRVYARYRDAQEQVERQAAAGEIHDLRDETIKRLSGCCSDSVFVSIWRWALYKYNITIPKKYQIWAVVLGGMIAIALVVASLLLVTNVLVYVVMFVVVVAFWAWIISGVMYAIKHYRKK
jgi:hypothetical protein